MAADEELERSTGIGGSVAPAVVGIDPWQSRLEAWMRLRGELPPLAETEPMLWGKLHEATIAEEYSRRTGRPAIKPEGMLRSAKYPWMIGHLDRIIDRDRILEIKTARQPIGWGEPRTDEIPAHYGIQCHHYLIVSGARVCDVAVLIGGSDLRLYTVEADQGIADSLISQEYEFWQLVQSGEPPAPTTMQDAIRRWGRLDVAGRVEAGEAEYAAVEELRALRARMGEMEAREAAARTTIMTALGEHGDTLVDARGTPLASWRIDNGRKAYTVAERGPARRFLLRD